MNLKIPFFCTTLLILSQNIFAQSNSRNHNNIKANNEHKFKPKTQLQIFLSPILNQKIKISNNGENWLNSNPSFGFALGSNIHFSFLKNLGIDIGGGINIVSYCYNYYFDSRINNSMEVFNQDLKHREFIPYTNLNLGLTYLSHNPIKINKSDFNLLFSAGTKVNSIPTFQLRTSVYFYIDENNPDVRTFEAQLEDLSDSNKLLFKNNSYYFKIGVINQTKKHNTINTNLVVNHSPNSIGKGSYQFNNLEHQSSGILDLRLNYIGLEFLYGFTFSKTKKV